MGHVTDFYGFNNCGDLDLSQESSELLSRDNLLDLPDISGSCFNEDSYRSSLPSYIQNNTEQNGCFSEPLYDYLFDTDAHFNIDFDAPTSVADNEHTDLIRDSIISTPNLEVNERKNSVEKLLIGNSKIQLDTGQEEDSYSPAWDDEIVLDGSKINNYSVESASDPADSDTGISPIPKLIIKLQPEPKSSNADSLTPMTIADHVKLGGRRSGSFKSDGSVKGNQKRKSKKKLHQRKHFPAKQKEKSGYGSSTDSSFQSKSFVQELVHNQNIDDNPKDIPSDFCEVENSYPLSLDDENSSDNRPFHINLDVFSDDSSEHDSNFLSTSLDVGRVAPLQMKHSELFNVGDSGNSFSFSFDGTNTSSELTGGKKELNSFVDTFTGHCNSFSGNIPERNISLVDEKEPSANACVVISKTKKRKKKAALEKNDQKVNRKPPSKKEFSASDLIEELNAHNQQVFEEIEVSTPDLELELTDETKCVQGTSASSVQICNPLPACANESISHQSTVSKDDENDLNFENHMPKDKKSPHDSDSDSVQSKYSNCNSTSYSKSNGKAHRCYRKRRDKSSSTSPERERWLNKPVKYDPVTDTYRDEFGCEVRPNEFKSTSDSKHRYRVSRSRSRSPRHRNRHRHYKSRSRSRSQRRRKHSSESKSHSYSHKYRDSEYKRRSPSPRHRKRHYMDLEENIKANEERRVMYVGDIPPGYTVEQLKQRFERFGPIQDATIKSKNTSDCSVYVFGFVTFKNRSDACAAIENGNTDMWPKFELNFGGRRRFCNGNYTDLDGKIAETESGWYGRPTSSKKQLPPADDFAELLRLEQKRLGMG